MPQPEPATHETIWFWIVFLTLVGGAMVFDLGVLHRKTKRVETRDAMILVGVWIGLAIAFNVYVFFSLGAERALEFLTGYIVEYSLSVDNIFVFIMIFTYFAVPAEYQHRVLFWGIIGAAIMRMLFIFLFYDLVERFDWLLYIFAAFLIASGVKFLRGKEVEVRPERNPILRIARRFLRVTPGYQEHHFIARYRGRLHVTPLFLVLLVVEATDVVFAVDSVPAIRGVTSDRFIAYTSNIFAILGLRSMYFLVAGFLDKFHYLKKGLSLVLIFIGIKMALHSVVPIHPAVSLAVVIGLLGGSMALSLLRPPPRPPAESQESQGEGPEERGGAREEGEGGLPAPEAERPEAPAAEPLPGPHGER